MARLQLLAATGKNMRVTLPQGIEQGPVGGPFSLLLGTAADPAFDDRHPVQPLSCCRSAGLPARSDFDTYLAVGSGARKMRNRPDGAFDEAVSRWCRPGFAGTSSHAQAEEQVLRGRCADAAWGEVVGRPGGGETMELAS
ncbi:hypothetical protein BO1005MUT1_190047 [Hyphomicrobiales bacterium]|nr:hypothetical protein BO1005MUT1_190047 [Hyphomicrobiales bacterium]